MMKPINELIDNIKTENSKIDTIFEEMTKKVKKIKKFNNELIRELEIFIIKSTIMRNKIFKEHFDKLNNFLNLSNPMMKCSLKLQTLQKSINFISQKTKFITQN